MVSVIEKPWGKEEILEAYLNVIALGYNTKGVQAAANMYFDKDVSEFETLEELKADIRAKAEENAKMQAAMEAMVREQRRKKKSKGD